MPNLTFIEFNGIVRHLEVPVGMTFLQAARKYSVDIEAACGGSLSCATCHVIVDDAWFDKLPPPREDEERMLDVAFDITPTSRLACQLRMTAELDGCIVKVAAENGSLSADAPVWEVPAETERP